MNRFSESGSSLNSSQVEELLLGLFREMRESPKFAELKEVLVGKLWDHSFSGTAPFIESLTFHQLVGMEVSQLIQKKSFTVRKALGIERTIKRALGLDADGGDQGADTQGKEERQRVLAPRRADFPWVLREGESPLRAALYAWVESAWQRAGIRGGELGALTSRLPATLSLSEFFRLWIFAELPLMELNNEPVIEGSGEEAARKLLVLVREIAPGLYSQWKTLLNQPALPFDSFVSGAGGVIADRLLERSLIKIVLRSMGGESLELDGTEVTDCWTAKPAALPLIVEKVLKDLPLSEEDFSSQIELLIPGVPWASLRPALLSRARFDRRRNKWYRRRKR